MQSPEKSQNIHWNSQENVGSNCEKFADLAGSLTGQDVR